MTLVAAYWEHGHPVLIGDLLLTRGIPTDGFCLPTLGEVCSTDGERYVSQIQRKLVRISNQLCIGWTGALSDALREIKQLYLAFHTDRIVKREEFFDFAKAVNVKPIELVLVGLFIDEEGLFSFQWDWQSIKLNLGWHYFCGSGKDYLDRYDDFNLLNTEEDLPENSSGVVEAIKKCAILLGDEVTSASTIAMNFGGGVELATYIDNGLKFINGLGFVFFKCKYENGSISTIDFYNNIIINQYFGEMLWICSVARDEGNNPITRIYGLPPFVGEYDKKTTPPKLTDFSPQTIAFYFDIEVPNLSTSLVLIDICYQPINSITSFEIQETGIEIKLEPSFMKTIEEQVAQRLAKAN